MANRYWVGGSGAWDDISHWATSSGGSGGSSAPNSTDRAIFDESSGPGIITATIDGDVSVGGLDSSLRTSGLSILLGAQFAKYFVVDGNINLSKTTTGPGVLVRVVSGTRELRMDNVSSVFSLTVLSGGKLVLATDASVRLLSTSNGSFDTGGFACNISAFNVIGTTNSINLRGSTITVASRWEMNPPGSVSFDSGTSTIIVRGGSRLKMGGHTYHNLIFEKVASSVPLIGDGDSTAVSSTGSVRNLEIIGGVRVENSASMTPTITILNSLSTTSVGGTKTTFRPTTPGRPFIFRKTSGVVNVSDIDLQGSIAQGGAIWNAYGSIDSGNNTGWNFIGPPTAEFTASPLSGTRPLDVGFINLTTGGTGWSWDFGDSTGSSLKNPIHTYTQIGSYTVSLTASNASGAHIETKTAYIKVLPTVFSSSSIGTLVFSGGINRPTLFGYRGATGTLVFGGETRAIILRDAEVIQDKTYLYKVYEPDGTYIETWKDVISDLAFTHEINTVGSTTTVELARNSDSVGVVTSPLQDESGVNLLTEDDQTILVATESRNQIGSGSSVDYNNRVDITAYYGSVEPLYTEDMDEILTEDDEQILADIGAPNGRRVFTGFISEINSRYGNSETTIVQLTSYGFDLDQFPVTTAYNNNTTTVAFNSYDPSNIARVGVDRFMQTAALEQTSYTMRTDTSIDNSGTIVSYTFRNNTYKELLDKTLELLPSNWYYRVGLGDNIVYVKERSAVPDHRLYLGKHIKALDLKGSIMDVVNHTLFTGGGDPALYVERKEAPAPRTRRGLEIMSDARVTLQSSAEIISDGKIEDANKLQYRTTVEVLSKQYDIESIQVGETIGFRNFGNYVDNLTMQVVGLAYSPDSVQLQLETKPPTINKRLSDIQRNLAVQENQNLPSTPS